MAEAARQRLPGAVQAVLLYGSSLRDDDDRDKLIDLYLLVESYRAAYANPLTRLANRLLPPNVYYLEAPFEGRTIRSKYSVVSLPQFARLVSPATLQSYFWARFTQPVRLLWVADETARQAVTGALVQAAVTTAGATLPLVGPNPDGRQLCVRAFQESYRTELRAERAGRANELYESAQAYYDRLAALAGEAAPKATAAGRWRWRRWAGKPLSVLRLLKAAFTFQDGGAYLLWKIERHSGVRETLTPWQRRHPILAASFLFWRLYRKGAFR